MESNQTYVAVQVQDVLPGAWVAPMAPGSRGEEAARSAAALLSDGASDSLRWLPTDRVSSYWWCVARAEHVLRDREVTEPRRPTREEFIELVDRVNSEVAEAKRGIRERELVENMRQKMCLADHLPKGVVSHQRVVDVERPTDEERAAWSAALRAKVEASAAADAAREPRVAVRGDWVDDEENL